mgnify:CR=1 FL=1
MIEFEKMFSGDPVYLIEDITDNGNKILISEVKSDGGAGYIDSLLIVDKNNKTLWKGKFKRELYSGVRMKYDSQNMEIQMNINEKLKIFQIGE